MLHRFGHRPLFGTGKPHLRGICCGIAAEETALPAFPLVAGRLCGRQYGLYTRKNRCTIGFEFIESPCRNKVFKATPVDLRRIGPVGKIVQITIGAIGQPFGDNSIHRLFTNIFEARQGIAHSQTLIAFLHTIFGIAVVDRWRQAMRPHAAHIIDKHRKLVGLVHVETH